MSAATTRRGALRLAALSAASVALGASALTGAEAMAEAKAARKGLDALAEPVAAKDFAEFRRLLRAGPVSRVRASCSALVRDVGEGERSGAQERYRKLIGAVEEVDGLALKAVRNGDSNGVLESFDRAVTAFDAFLGGLPAV